MGLVKTMDQCLALAVLPHRVALRKREQWLSANEIAAGRRQRLANLLRQARRAPYYAQLFREFGLEKPENFNVAALRRLPFLDKQVLSSRPIEDFLTVNRKRLLQVATSGSTGHIATFLRSPAEEADFSARWWRVYAAYGCTGLDRQVNIAAAGKKDRSGPIGLLRRVGVLPRVTHIASTAPPAQNAQVLRDERPRILAGYAVAIEALADHLISSNTHVQPPRVVICAAMEVSEHCRRLAERAFRAPVANVYVSNEVGVIAWACPLQPDALHVNDDAFELEIVDEQGQPVAAGVRGEVVVTPLVQTSMPLLRYRIGDMAARLDERCACGRGFSLITPIQGRTAHVIRHASGHIISGPAVTMATGKAAGYEWIRRLQLREQQDATLQLLLEVKRTPTDAETKRLLVCVQEAVSPHYRLELQIVPAIPFAPSGKFQSVIPRSA